MSSDRPKWKFRVRHVLDGIAQCRSFVAGMGEQQLGDDKRTLYAVVWALTVIGEAARHVPQEVIDRFPEIPWQQMRGMRNHIVHGYDRIKLEIVWEVVTRELPPLVPHLERILREAEE